ncbi:MAG: HD domain-containing protein [Deinococcota bacterium]
MPNSPTHPTALTSSLNTTYQPLGQHQQPKVIDAPRYQRWYQRWYNRVCRGLLAFIPWIIAVDDELAHSYLTPEEYVLFTSMDVRDQQHACWVAEAVLRYVPDASDVLVAAALLHDVGKADVPFVPLERILVHVLERIYPHEPPMTPRQRGWRGIWQRKCHHESYGAELIRYSGGRTLVAHIIEMTAQMPSRGTANSHANSCLDDITKITDPTDIRHADDISVTAYLLHCIDQYF